MIELPEAITLSQQLKQTLVGKVIKQVYPPSYEHKFTWFHGEADNYNEMLKGQKITNASAVGIYVEIETDSDIKFNFNDGVNPRYCEDQKKKPNKYQLLIEFMDNSFVYFTVAMYGGFSCHKGDFDNKYYLISMNNISPLSDEFDYDYFQTLFASVKDTISVKAFLATEQRIPGLGNGVLQDILLVSHIHPKRKLNSLTETDKSALFQSIKTVLKEMTEAGGRDTEKDLFGNPGRYLTRLSKITYKTCCPVCGSKIEKQSFLGGTIYTCPRCQPYEP